MNADEILAIPLTEPSRLLSKDNLREDRLRLFKLWHPDRNHDPKAGAVFDHINKLLAEGERQIAAGTWSTPGLLVLDHKTGRYEVRYLAKRSIEIGDMYVGRTAVVFVIDRSFEDLVLQARQTIGKLSYPSASIEEQIKRFMPEIIGSIETTDKIGFVVKKSRDVLLLDDVIASFKDDRLPDVHIAWVISSLMNLACYAQITGLTLGGLELGTTFVSPPFHTTPLLAGWWFAAAAGDKLKALSSSATSALPASLIKNPTTRITTELIKQIGRDLTRGSGPAPMREWLNLPSSSDAIKDYGIWQHQVLKDSFGERRFSKLEVTETDLYR